MKENFGLKLIVVANLNAVRLYEAKGIKITDKIEELPLAVHKTPRHQQGSYKLGRNLTPVPGSAFEPHTVPKDIELQETARIIARHLDTKINDSSPYQELVIIAEPKLLGHLKQQFSKRLKEIVSQEIAKDYAHQGVEAIEQCVFG